MKSQITRRLESLEGEHDAEITEYLSGLSDAELAAIVAQGDEETIRQFGETEGRRRIAGRNEWLAARSDEELREIAAGRLPG